MNSLRQKALQLRIKGKSYNEISLELKIPKSTLSLWLRDVVLSDAARERIAGRLRQGVQNGFVKRNKLQTHLARQRTAQIRKEASLSVSELNKKDLLLAGALLYWAEGYKRPVIRGGRELTAHVISFVNSDPDMVAVFVLFLQKVLGIPSGNIRLCMRLYNHINEAEARRYWTKVSGLSEVNFVNSTYLVSGASKGKRPITRLPYGTLQVAVNNTPKFYELMGFIDGVKEKLRYDTMSPLLG